MADVIVKIFPGDEVVFSESFSTPVTAAQVKDRIRDINAAWVGRLTEASSSSILLGHHQLVPGGTYHLVLQEGKYCNTQLLLMRSKPDTWKGLEEERVVNLLRAEHQRKTKGVTKLLGTYMLSKMYVLLKAGASTPL